jgi:hypothetical protein
MKENEEEEIEKERLAMWAKFEEDIEEEFKYEEFYKAECEA